MWEQSDDTGLEPNHLQHLFKENYHSLVFFAYKIIASQSDAEDIVQDAFVKFWNNRQNVADHFLAVKSYLYTTVRNDCLNVLKHRAVIRKQETSLNLDEADEQTALQYLLESETLVFLYKAIETLPPVCKKIAEMSHFHGMKNDEIADKLGISVNSVKTQKQRALELLKKRLPSDLMLFFL